MKRLLKYLIVALTLAAIWLPALAQSDVNSLREQIRLAEEEIRINTELLEKSRKDQAVSESQLKLIQSRIRSRQDVVNSLEKQITLINNDINSKRRSVDGLNGELETLKEEYADMVRLAYRNYKLNNFLLFLFASDDFNDATRRLDFMRRYNRMRVEKAEQIRVLTDSISVQVKLLDEQKAELDGTKATHGSELNSLQDDRRQYQSSVNSLRAQQADLDKKLSDQQKVIDRAQSKIREIVEAEARRNVQESGGRTEAEDRYFAELSGRFDENKGKLPYPLYDGVVIDHHGTHAHATQRGLTVNNTGVNIAGEKGAEVKCVFEGVVTRIFSLAGYNNCVMVRHGEYITLYANMSSVAVRTGDNVSPGQRVGRIAASSNNDDNFLHFEIWKQTTNLNPEEWLRR